MQTTANYGLKKPEGTDVVDIQDLNDNTDVIDLALKQAMDAAGAIGSHADTHRPSGSDPIPTAAPSGGLGTANAIGSSTSLARADHTHLAFDSTNPVVNGTASAGLAATAARRDHVHPIDTTRAPLASPSLTGTPTAPTAAVDTSTTQIATTAFVTGQAGTVTPNMDGAGAVGTSKKYAREDHIHPIDTSRAPLASPELTGTPTAPTAAADTNTTQVATTAFVLGQAGATSPVMDGASAVGTSKRYARADHVHPTDTSRAAQGDFAAHLVDFTNQINRLSYDIYNLYQEQYYTGKSPVSPSYGAAKSIFFDPLIDTTTYNSANSSVYFNAISKIIKCSTDPNTVNVTPPSIVRQDFGGVVYKKQVSGASESVSLDSLPSILTDGVANLSAGYTISGGSSSFDIRFPMKIDFGANKVVTGVRLHGNRYDANGIFTIYDAQSIAILGSVNCYYNGGGWTETIFSSPVVGRYFCAAAYATSTGSSARVSFSEFQFITTSYVGSLYRSNPFNLTFTPTKARVYLSSKLVPYSSVLPTLKCGGVDKPPYLLAESRPDPNFAGFTEETYEYDLTGMSKPTEFDMILTPSAEGSPEVKRYGIYFY